MKDPREEQAKHEAELMALTDAAFCERLRGVYRIPVNDGAGLLNGSNEYVRTFETGPIHHEAARRIEALGARVLLDALKPFAAIGEALDKAGTDAWPDGVSAKFMQLDPLQAGDFRKLAALARKLSAELQP